MEGKDGSPITFDYFVCVKRGNKIYDPLSNELFEEHYQQVLLDENTHTDEFEKFERDSADSNRESAEQNDYPDEEDYGMEGSENRNISSDESQGSSGDSEMSGQKRGTRDDNVWGEEEEESNNDTPSRAFMWLKKMNLNIEKS